MLKKIVTIGEILVEIMAVTPGDGFREPIELLGPYPSGAPAILPVGQVLARIAPILSTLTRGIAELVVDDRLTPEDKAAVTADKLEQKRVALEERRITSLTSSQASRLASQRASVEQRRALATLQRQQYESLQVRAGEEELVAAADHQPTRARVEPERLCVATIGAGCLAPVAAHHDGSTLHALIADEDGAWIERRSGDDPVALAHELVALAK